MKNDMDYISVFAFVFIPKRLAMIGKSVQQIYYIHI